MSAIPLRRKPPSGSAAPKGGAGGGGVSYFEVSRSLPASLLLIVPMLVVYEFGVLHLGRGPNAMATVAKGPLFVFGQRAALVFNALLIVGFVYAIVRLARWRALRWSTFPAMVAESGLYALLLAPVSLLAMRGQLLIPPPPKLPSDLWPQVVAAAGAGVYEELLFRGVLLTALMWIGNHVLTGEKKRPFLVFLAALAVSSALFSVWHFFGGAEAPTWPHFRYRFAAGAVLGVVFAKRGLGIAACAHALYNAFLVG